jgi:hypothetical protein
MSVSPTPNNRVNDHQRNSNGQLSSNRDAALSRCGTRGRLLLVRFERHGTDTRGLWLYVV